MGMFNWLSNLLPSAATTTSGTTPTGEAFAALAIKSNASYYPYDNTKPAVELVKGTIAACISARANERGVLRFVVLEDGKETITSKQIQSTLDKPNPVQSRTDFIEMCSQFHDCTGQAVIYFVDGDGNLPAEMWVLPSFFIEPLFDKADNPIPTAYRWADGRVIANNDQLCFIRNNSLKTAPYTGRGFLNDQFDNAVLYDLVVKSQKNWFINGGAPNVALSATEGTSFTAEQIKAMQAMWNEKYNPATGTTNIAFLPEGVVPNNFGPTELNFNVSKDEIRDSIREALQVPKMILGDTDNVNHNNGQTALAMFERLVILRWGQKFANALEHHFKNRYNSRITVDIDQKVTQGFTQLPSNNGVITTPEPFEFTRQNQDQL